MRLALITLAALSVSAPALAQAPVQAPAPAPAPASAAPAKKAEDPNRIVCVREHVVGSNRPKRVCMTVADRQRIREDAQRTMGSERGTTTDQNAGSGGS